MRLLFLGSFIFGRSGLYLTSNFNLLAQSYYGDILFYANNGGVGINLPDSPTAALDVDGTLRFRQTNPTPYKVLTANDNNGNADWAPNRSIRYPDGQFPMTPVTHRFSNGSFVVPAGKNLYITNTFNQYSGGYYITINGARVMQGYNNYNAYNASEGPIIAGPGQTIASNYNGVSFNGFLVDATVTAYTTNGTVSPGSATYVVTSICGLGSARPLIVNGITVYFGYGNFTTSASNYNGLREPILVGPGSTVTYNGGTINGYIITQ